MKPLTVEEVLYLHYRITKKIGGRQGVRALSLLQSALERPCITMGGRELYPAPFEKAAVLLTGILAGKPFYDNNAPTALAAALLLLGRFSLRVQPATGLGEMLAAAGKGDWRAVAAWLRGRSRPEEGPAAAL
ncbi:type II toxin-antitoxin system death-on-curing family toxin [Thermodesulfitimonas sp.]